MTIAEVICWIFVFATLLSLFIHQSMIIDMLKVYSDVYGNSITNSIFRVEKLLEEQKGTVLGTYEKDGIEYEMIERKIEKGDNNG